MVNVMIFNVVLLQGEVKQTCPCAYILTDDVRVYFIKSFLSVACQEGYTVTLYTVFTFWP